MSFMALEIKQGRAAEPCSIGLSPRRYSNPLLGCDFPQGTVSRPPAPKMTSAPWLMACRCSRTPFRIHECSVHRDGIERTLIFDSPILLRKYNLHWRPRREGSNRPHGGNRSAYPPRLKLRQEIPIGSWKINPARFGMASPWNLSTPINKVPGFSFAALTVASPKAKPTVTITSFSIDEIGHTA